MRRSISAFLLAPFPAALFQSSVVALWPKPGTGIFEHPASMFVALCLLFYGFGLVLGVPLGFVLARRGLCRMRHFGAAGALAALLPVVPLLAWQAARASPGAYVILYDLLVFGCGGWLAGALYWRIARPGRATPAPR